MSYSISRTVASGSTAVLNVPFPYLDKTHVHVFDNDIEVLADSLTWNSPNQIRLPNTPTAGHTMVVQRITPLVAPPVVFNPGSLATDDLNTGVLHSLYVEQEIADGLSRAISVPASDPPGLSYALPPVSSRRLQGLGFDSSGNVSVFQPSAAPVSAAMQPVVAASTTNGALAALAYTAPYTGGQPRGLLSRLAETVSVTDFGAVADANDDGGTDNTAAFQQAIDTKKSVFVPPGRYWIAGTIFMQNTGQELYGVQPNQHESGSDLVFGPGGAECISIGTMTGTPHVTYNWVCVRNLNLTCDNRVGTTGIPSGTSAGDPSTNATAISLYEGFHTHLENLNITRAWNGIFNYSGNSVELRDIVFTGVRGDFNELHTGPSSSPGEIASALRIQHSAAADVVVTTATDLPAGHHVIPLPSVAGINTGWTIRGQGSAFPNGRIVTAVDPVGNTVTINGDPTTGVLAGGTVLTFKNQCVGIWISSNFASYQGMFCRNQAVSTILRCDDPVNDGGSFPQDVWIYDLGGDGLGIGEKVDIQAGHDINLTEPHIYGGDSGGHGVFMGPSAFNLRIVGGEIANHYLAGLDIQGRGFQMVGAIVGQNGQQGAQTHAGVYISSTAQQVQLTGCKIGRQSSTQGQQDFGVFLDGTAAREVLIDGCDLRGNGFGAINDPSLAVLGTNQGLSFGGVTDPWAQYFLSWASPSKPSAVTAYANLIGNLRDAGLWSLCDVLMIPAAVDQATALINLKSPFQSSAIPTPTIGGTVSFSKYGGLTGNGSTGNIDLGFTPQALLNYQLNAASMYFWSGTNASSDTGFDVEDSTSDNFYLNGRNASGAFQHRANAASSATDTVANSSGSYGWSRGSSAAYSAHKDGVLLSSHSVVSSSVPTGHILLLGKSGGFSTRQCRAFWMGGFLTDAQVATLDTLVKAYLAAV